MLSKLVKYDIKSLIRVFIPVADGPLMNVFSEYIGPILLGILAVLFVAVIVGMMIMTLILVIRRFWNGLLKEEGYLAFTLPVEVWQLIVSKVIVAAIVFAATRRVQEIPYGIQNLVEMIVEWLEKLMDANLGVEADVRGQADGGAEG